jgi:hypothetical protein
MLANKKKIGAIVLASVLGVSGSCFALTTEGSDFKEEISKVFLKYEKKDEQQVLKDLRKLSKDKIVDEVNLLTKGNGKNEISDSGLIAFTAALVEKEEEFTNKELINLVVDSNNSVSAQTLYVDVYLHKNKDDIKAKKEIKEILKHKNVNKIVKTKVVAESDFDSTDKLQLIEFIQGDNQELGQWSLKKLLKVDAETAFNLSNEILLNKEGKSDQLVSGALQTTAKYIKSKKNKKEYKELEKDFLEMSKSIMKDSKDSKGSKDTIIYDSAFFAISDLMSENSLVSVLNDPTVEEQLKVFTIDQNFMVLEDILKNDPTDEEVEMVVKAMEILPIKDLADPLENMIGKVQDKDLEVRIQQVLKDMNEKGINANKKWLD